MKEKLISMVEKSKEINEIVFQENQLDNAMSKLTHIIAYAKLLSRKPVLSMFIEVDKNGKYLEMPKNYKMYVDNGYRMPRLFRGKLLECKEYQEAKERVLFVGWEYRKDYPQRIEKGELTMYFSKFNIYIYKGIIQSKKSTIKTLEDLTSYGLEIK